MMRMTPKTSVRPEAISAYAPPVRTPSAAASMTSVVKAGRRGPSWPVGLRVLRPGHGDRRRVDRHGPAGLPLDEERFTGRAAGAVEGHRALDGVVRAVVERVDQLRVVEAVDAPGRL